MCGKGLKFIKLSCYQQLSGSDVASIESDFYNSSVRLVRLVSGVSGLVGQLYVQMQFLDQI